MMLMLMCDENDLSAKSDNSRLTDNYSSSNASYRAVKNLTKEQKQNIINHIRNNIKHNTKLTKNAQSAI